MESLTLYHNPVGMSLLVKVLSVFSEIFIVVVDAVGGLVW